MNLSGLNNLSFAPKAAPTASKSLAGGKAEGPKSEREREPGSFERVLAKSSGPKEKELKKKNEDGEKSTGTDAEAMSSQNLPLSNPGNISPINEVSEHVANPEGPAIVNLTAKGKGKVAPVLNQEDGVDSLTRRVVWSDFLRKMKDKLGVSAEDVVKAFSSLSAEDLRKPPQETVNQVVSALGLTDQNQALARQYFQQLIQKTQAHSMGEELATSDKQINLTLMSQREMDRKAVSESLEKMNEKFFVKDQPKVSATEGLKDPKLVQDANAQDSTAPEVNEDLMALKALKDDPSAAQDFSPEARRSLDALTAEMKPVQNPSGKVDQLIQNFVQSKAGFQSQDVDGKVNSKESTSNSNKSASALLSAQGLTANPDAPLAMAASALAPAAHAPLAASTPMMSATQLNQMLGRLSGESSDTDSDQGDDAKNSSLLTAGLVNGGPKSTGPLNAQNDFQTQLTNVKNPGPVTVPDLIQKAQIMIKDGGGEMKVTMHPEGLGEVALKVSVDQGRVNVQMITESDEAKRLIQHQLGELKSSLSQNHLQLNDIKVDTASNLGKQLEQQYHDAQRQATQQQWDQFRQDSQGWRRSFFDTGSAKQYRGQGDAQRDVQAPTSTASARSRLGNKRLDLVA